MLPQTGHIEWGGGGYAHELEDDLGLVIVASQGTGTHYTDGKMRHTWQLYDVAEMLKTTRKSITSMRAARRVIE